MRDTKFGDSEKRAGSPNAMGGIPSPLPPGRGTRADSVEAKLQVHASSTSDTRIHLPVISVVAAFHACNPQIVQHQ